MRNGGEENPRSGVKHNARRRMKRWRGTETRARKESAAKGRERLTTPGCRNVWTCGTDHEFIANSLRIFQVISPVMSEGYTSDDECVRCHEGTKVNHLQFNIPFSLSLYLVLALLGSSHHSLGSHSLNSQFAIHGLSGVRKARFKSANRDGD